ncbi:MAG: alpha/beta fold hydrolase, partial [Bacteroidales bacterium]|nr:alpha/beta fold hydrolase [Bacteroidales bacterium]
MDPVKIQNGLAVYSLGEGPAVFLMPYPHASSARSTADGRFAELILHSGFRVITFDPPSFARSTRTSSSDLHEMFACTIECLEYFNIGNPIPFLGHSMGGFCALALSIEHPAIVSGLLLSGSPSGWNDVKKYSIHKKWNWWEKKFWLSRYYGLR